MGPKISDLGIFGVEFEIVFVTFEIRVLEFHLLQSLVQKQKSLNLGLKIIDLGIIWLGLENDIGNQHP